jgi:hypothetical protein
LAARKAGPVAGNSDDVYYYVLGRDSQNYEGFNYLLIVV